MTKLPKKENATVEFKTTFNEETIESLVAFSNAKGGTVYVGVSDSGKTQGVTVGKETIPNWINEIKLKTTPQIIADADIITVDKKQYIIYCGIKNLQMWLLKSNQMNYRSHSYCNCSCDNINRYV
jgi:predicted HTH transcriptional regulator